MLQWAVWRFKKYCNCCFVVKKNFLPFWCED